MEREEQGWLEWFVGKLGRYQVTPRVHDEASAVAYLKVERAAILALLRDWRVLVVEGADESSPADLLRRVRDGLGRMDG